MKKNICLALLGTFMLSGIALADPAYTLTTSANMVDNYSVYDSGLQHVQGNDYLSQTQTNNTSANVLYTFQDMVSLQWYAHTEFTTTTTYATLYQEYQQDSRYLQLSTYAPAPANSNYTNNWFDLSLTADAGLTQYSVYAQGTAGVRTTPRGLTQLITPAMGVAIDGTATSGNWQLNSSDHSAWSYLSGSLVGTTSSSFQMVTEATDGGSISYFQMSLSSEKILGNQRTDLYSYVSAQWAQDVAVSAPVPEPQTYAMLLAGLIFVGSTLRRRSQG